MTKLSQKLEEKQKAAEGLLTQTKGVVKEQWGNLTHDEVTSLDGKKDQVIGKFQTRFGGISDLRNGKGLLLATAVASLVVVPVFFYLRRNAR